MTMFVVANLGDVAEITFPTSIATVGGTVAMGGVIFVQNGTAAPMTLTLSPSLQPFVLVKDASGNANTYPITITSIAGIDGGFSTLLAVPYQWVQLFWNGTSYSITG